MREIKAEAVTRTAVPEAYYHRVPGTAEPASSGRAASLGARVVAFLFFGAFFAAGSLFFYFTAGVPLARVVQAQWWQRAQCEILNSRVGRNESDDGTTYRVEVVYRYFVDDRPHQGDRYQFSRMSSSGYSGKAAIVGTLTRGTRVDCWVNPANHAESVIKRGPTLDPLFGLLPLIFIAIGAGGLYGVVATWGSVVDKPAALTARTTTTGAAFVKAVRGAPSAALRPKTGRVATLIGLTIMSLFWNGIVSVFLVTLFTGKVPGGAFSWGLALFLVPFVIAGALLILFTVAQAMALANPRPLVTVSSPVVALGDEVRIDWTMEGRVSKLSRLTLSLEGHEHATYTRGTDTRTETHCFSVISIAVQEAPRIDGRGSARVRMPAGTMHSFDGKHNKIVWTIRVRGEVPRWPDSTDVFPITVAPRHG